MKYHSFSDYKRIAYQFLANHGYISKKSLPVDIENLIDKAGITIHPVPFLFRDFGVKGTVLK